MSSDEPLCTSPAPVWPGPSGVIPCWWERRLIGGLVCYQVVVTLLGPPWLRLSSAWLTTFLAWLALLGVAFFSRWTSRAHLPERGSWWLLSAGLGCSALAETFWLIGYLRFAGLPPFPWWSDLFQLFAIPCFFLALLLLPGEPRRRHTNALVRLRLFFDSLLVMGAATLLTWYFLLEHLPLRTGLLTSAWGHAPGVSDRRSGPALPADTALPGRSCLPEIRATLGFWLVASLCVILGNGWYAVRFLQGHALPSAWSDLFWVLAYLCFPLAALVRFRQARHAPMPAAAWSVRLGGLTLQREDLLEGLRLLLPVWVALLTGVLILVQAVLQSQAGQSPILALVTSAVLLGLVLLRQGVVFLEQAQLRHERNAARASEQAVRETNQQMETFLGLTSHELKTPLTSLLLGLERLHRRFHHLRRQLSAGRSDVAPEVEAMHTLAETTLQQGGRLNRLVHELLDFSRIRAGRFDVHRQPADLVTIVQRVVQEQRLVNPERTILLQGVGGASVPVSADAERLGQAVTNYLSNALRYSEETAPVEVGVRVEGRQGHVWVRDQGPGIPPDEQERLWERFYRVPGMAVQSGSGGGLGLGLYLSRMIIEQHGGQVGVQSVPGAGSTFWCTLPLAPDEQGQKGAAGEDLEPLRPPPDPAKEPGKHTPQDS